MKRECQEVWRCAAGHEVCVPLGHHARAVVCGICSRAQGPMPRVTDGTKTWSMKKVLVRSTNGRMVSA